MDNLKSIILHAIPVVILALAAIFGLTAEEQSTLVQTLTTIAGGVFAIIPIVLHHKATKQK